MALDNEDFDIDGITADGARAIEGAASSEALNQVEIEFLGKRSALTRAHRALGGLDPEARKEAGRRLGEAQAQLRALLAARRAALSGNALPTVSTGCSCWYPCSLPLHGSGAPTERPPPGHHPAQAGAACARSISPRAWVLPVGRPRPPFGLREYCRPE